MNSSSTSNSIRHSGSIHSDSAPAKPCWKEIGVWGTNTCETLAQVSHCYDCRVYSSAGTQLLQRAIAPEYRAQQTAQLAAPLPDNDSSQLFSVLIFRLAQEWLALPAGLCQQVLSPLAPHTLPHRTNNTLLGIVNIRGQLMLKVSLLEILGLEILGTASAIDATESAVADTKVYPRMIVVKKTLETGGEESWVFDVDELHGIHALSFGQLEKAAAGASVGANTCTRNVFSWNGQRVSCLDDVRFFEALRQRAL